MAGAANADAATAIPSAIFLILDSPLTCPPACNSSSMCWQLNSDVQFSLGGATHSHSPDIQGFRRDFVPAPDAPDDRKASGEVHFASFCCAKATLPNPPPNLARVIAKAKKMAGASAPALRLRSQEERSEAGSESERGPDPANLGASVVVGPLAMLADVEALELHGFARA